jgi:hypothetical protein
MRSRDADPTRMQDVVAVVLATAALARSEAGAPTTAAHR